MCSPHRVLSNDILFVNFRYQLTLLPFFRLASVQNRVSRGIIRNNREGEGSSISVGPGGSDKNEGGRVVQLGGLGVH
jgi:hypothetical protein